MNYNIWNKWDPLKVCMLGNNYAPQFFNGIPDKVGDPLKRICEETLEDLDSYKETLKQFGVEVIQPEMDSKERFLDNPHRSTRGPLQPRDYQMVIGNTCFTRNIDHPAIAQTLVKYCETDTVDTKDLQLHEFKYNQVACFESGDWPTYDDYISGVELEDFVKQEIDALEFESFPISSADSFFIDDRLLIGANYNYIKDAMPGIKKLIQFYTGKDISVELSMMDGHIDANFHPIKPGAIISLKDVQNYAQTFPGWDICYLPDQSWNKVKPFMKLKTQNKGKWWLAGEEDNAEFTNFVETWLQDWVGYVEETVFDVNVLMLDEHHCCVANPHNQKVNAFLKKHHVEPIYVPWRHRFFWDGGLHCITLDLYREGKNKC
jgi:N-dimethylarginine dimethylaminohydrolase